MSESWIIDAGVTKARYGLVLAKFSDPTKAPTVLHVVGMWNDIEEAKEEARRRFSEFNPGMAMIQDTKDGSLIRAYNWCHDLLLWAPYLRATHDGDRKEP